MSYCLSLTHSPALSMVLSMLSEDGLRISRSPCRWRCGRSARFSFKTKPTLGMMDELKQATLAPEYKEYVALAPAVTTPISSPPPPTAKQYGRIGAAQ